MWKEPKQGGNVFQLPGAHAAQQEKEQASQQEGQRELSLCSCQERGCCGYGNAM